MTAERPDAVTVAYVHNTEVAYSWYHSMLQLLVTDLGNHGRIRRGGHVAIRCASAGQLATARNQAVRHFLADARAPWLLWADTDMGFAADTVERLIEHADPVERPIVGALCFAQQEVAPDGMGGWQTQAVPTIFDWVTDGTLEGFEANVAYPPDALVRCAGTGSACVLIHRGAFERIEAEYGQAWYDRIPAREGSVGEDLSFCMRATAVDLPIHVATGVKTTHLKRLWLGEDDFHAQPIPAPDAEEVEVA